MYTLPVPPGAPLEYMNCCQPKQVGFSVGKQSKVVNGLVLSCSEKTSGRRGRTPLTNPLMLVTPITLSNDPTAPVRVPVSSAEKSLPSPAATGRGPIAGVLGWSCGVVQATSCHSSRGYFALKQPFFGRGTSAIALFHSS